MVSSLSLWGKVALVVVASAYATLRWNWPWPLAIGVSVVVTACLAYRDQQQAKSHKVHSTFNLNE